MSEGEGAPDLDARIVFQCPFTDVGLGEKEPTPHYYSEQVGDDWAGPYDGGWAVATTYTLRGYVKFEVDDDASVYGVIDLNDLPFGTESIIEVNPDGTPGKEYRIGVSETFGNYKVIDTYVNPYGGDDDVEQRGGQ